MLRLNYVRNFRLDAALRRRSNERARARSLKRETAVAAALCCLPSYTCRESAIYGCLRTLKFTSREIRDRVGCQLAVVRVATRGGACIRREGGIIAAAALQH